MGLRKLARIVGITGLFAVSLVVFPATPAAACSCAGPTSPDGYLRQADAAFLGDVIAARIQDPESVIQGNLRLGSPSMVFTFDVQEVYKGSVRERQEVVSNLDGAACGAGLEINHRYLVFARGDGSRGPLATSLCDGTSPPQADGSHPLAGGPVRSDHPPEPPPGEVLHGPSPSIGLGTFAGLMLVSAAIAGALIAVAGRR